MQYLHFMTSTILLKKYSQILEVFVLCFLYLHFLDQVFTYLLIVEEKLKIYILYLIIWSLVYNHLNNYYFMGFSKKKIKTWEIF